MTRLWELSVSEVAEAIASYVTTKNKLAKNTKVTVELVHRGYGLAKVVVREVPDNPDPQR